MYTEELNTILKRFARKLTRRHDVDDLVQQTFLKMYSNSEKFEGVNITPWACTILKNEFINECRKKKNEFESLNDAKGLCGCFNADSTANVYYINKQINNLSLPLKSCFIDFLLGFKYEEIAERHKEPLGTIKNRIFRAKQILSKVA